MNRPAFAAPSTRWRPVPCTPSPERVSPLPLLAIVYVLLMTGGIAWAGVLEPDVNLCDCRTPQGLILDPGTYGDAEPEFWIGQPVVLTYEWSGDPPPNCNFLPVHRWGDLGKCGDPQPPQGWLPYQYSGTVRTGMDTSWTAEMDIGYVLTCDGDHIGREETLSKELTFRVPQVSVSVEEQWGPRIMGPECGIYSKLILQATLLDPVADQDSIPGRVFWTQQVGSRHEVTLDSGHHYCRDQSDQWYRDGAVDLMDIPVKFSLYFRDTPFTPLEDIFSEVLINSTFKLRLVYDSGCCLVPLYELEWSYAAIAVQSPGGTGCASWKFAYIDPMPRPSDPTPLYYPNTTEFPAQGDCYDPTTMLPIEVAAPNQPCE